MCNRRCCAGCRDFISVFVFCIITPPKTNVNKIAIMAEKRQFFAQQHINSFYACINLYLICLYRFCEGFLLYDYITKNFGKI